MSAAPVYIAIAAMSENRVIGSNNRLPWNLPDELKWFKQQTMGKTLLMGRKTFASIGRPLPHRTTIVLSRARHEIPGVQVIHNLDQLPAVTSAGEIWVCGGSEIYALTLSRWSEVFLTRVKRMVVGDATFPAFEELFPPPVVVRDTPEYTILHFRRVTV